MNDDMLGRFLNGDANEEEFKLCETLLEDANTVVDEHRFEKCDPLVASLRARQAQPAEENSSTGELVQRIEGLVMRQTIGREDLERLLDEPQHPDELGRIGKYCVIEFIAAGGMGLVFKAEDTELNRLVCIKIMHPALALKPDAKLRFERESRAAARLRSERIVTLLDIGVQRDLPYIVMQLLDGESLRSKLSREGKLPAELAVHYVMQMAEALRHAHAMGILHRDIKPDNIWVTPEGDIKLLDFGLARPLEEAGNLTTTGGLIGTPQYMSPEQIQGQTLDARSDLFSVGVVLFEMLTGSLPFQKNNLFSTMIAITNDSVSLPPSELPSEIVPHVESILHNLLKKNPDERIQSARELIEQLSDLGSLRSASPSPAVHPTKVNAASARRSNSGRMPYVLAGVVGGLCTTLLGILVVQTTNKGTLVVRTEDPQVEIRVAQEKVTIQDPLSGRSFEVQVGRTTLPGGVYQLEMNDATSGLTFSSRTIAIRRGETVIVEVELQPVPQVAAATNQSTKNDVLAPTPANAEPSGGDKSADPSFDLKAREDFARVLERLPALPVDSAAAAMPVDRSESSAATQQKLSGIDSWSIDASDLVGTPLSPNSNGTLFAASHGNSVKIWDKTLKLKYNLPTVSATGNAIFDNKYPNLIAVCCFIQGLEDLYKPGALNFELTVWRLGADYAEVIYRIPCADSSFAWDQGYRLFHTGQEGLAAFRLDQGKAYALHGPDGTILGNAVSTSGRFLASRNNANIDVWDLKLGEFAFTALSTSRAQWNQQGDRAAFFTARRPAFEIWDLEERSIDDKVELPAEPTGPERSDMKTAVIGLEPTFQRVAWLSPQGSLTVRNLQTNREAWLMLPNKSTSKIREAAIQWEGSSFVVETDRSAFVWTHDKSDVQGTLKEREPSPDFAKKQGVQLDFSRVLGSRTPVLFWKDLAASNRNSNMRARLRERENEMYFDAFNITSNKFYREAPLSQDRNSSYSRTGTLSDDLGPPFFSHDGKYATGPLQVTTPGSGPQSRGEVLLYSLISCDPPVKLKADSAKTLWDRTGRFAFFVQNAVKSVDGNVLIYDIETNEFIDEKAFAQASGKLIELQPRKQGFAACLRVDRPQAETARSQTPTPKFAGDLEVWIIDPVMQQAKKSIAATNLLAKVTPVESISVTDQYLFASSLGRPDTSEDPATVKKIFRIAFDESRGSKVEFVTVPVIDDFYFSASGEYLMREARDAVVTSSVDFAGRKTRALNTRGPSELLIARWSDVAQDLGDIDALENQASSEATDWSTLTQFKQVLNSSRSNGFQGMQWHPTVDVAAWSNYGSSHFFDTSVQQLRTHLSLGRATSALNASDKGWTSTDRDEVQFFDPPGRLIGRLIFDPELVNMKPSNPRWILADGSMASQCATDGLSISYLKGNRFYCASVEEFERARPDVKLPRSDHIPGLEL